MQLPYLRVDTQLNQLQFSGNTISTFANDDDINITPNGAGEVVAASLTVSDLTNTRITFTGANGLEDSANLTFDGTNLLIASTGKLYLNDAGGEHISGNGSVLSIAGGSEIDLTATAIDINGTCDVSGISTFSAAVGVGDKPSTFRTIRFTALVNISQPDIGVPSMFSAVSIAWNSGLPNASATNSSKFDVP